MDDDHRGDDFPNKGNYLSHLRSISHLPHWAWGVAGLLSIAPAVGFYLLINRLAPYPEPAFLFVYWAAALYVSVRKATVFIQVLKRIGIILALESLTLLFVALFL